MNSPILLPEDEFDRQYPLLVNHLDPHATWACGDGPGCLFGLSRPEIQFVRAQDPCSVWTLVDDGAGGTTLISGLHFVNRIGYLVSTVPLPAGQFIEVHLETECETEGDNT